MQMNLCVFFISELFNMCIVHGYIPNSCLNTTIVPISKNKNGNMSDTSNYRPVAVATVVLLQSNKDSVVMHQLSNFICLGLNQ